jgi:hypothetical protein
LKVKKTENTEGIWYGPGAADRCRFRKQRGQVDLNRDIFGRYPDHQKFPGGSPTVPTSPTWLPQVCCKLLVGGGSARELRKTHVHKEESS